MTGIVSFAVNQWRMTLAVLAFIVIGGILSMFTITLDAEPDVAIPFVTVRVVLPGVSPEDSERLLVKPIENELKSLDGVKKMNGVAVTSTGIVILEFNPDFEPDTAITDVLEAVNKARGELPEEAKEPLVEEIDIKTLPIIVVNLYGSAPDRLLQKLAKDLQAALESNSQVLEATIQGEREEVLEAIIDPTLMESNGITYTELASAISRNNRLVTAGKLETRSGGFAVKVPGLIETATDLSEIVIRTEPDGSILQIKDIALVRRNYKNRTGYATFQNKPSVSLEISKRSDASVMDTIIAVREIINTTSKNWPETVQMELSQDQTFDIMNMLRSLVSSIVNAVVLVVIVCIVAIGIRSALMVGFAIPASFFVTVFLLNVQGSNINMMVMFAMILSVGILVDSAIVIIEYADRKLAEGLGRKEAYILAGERMFWPIVSSTATTLAAFIPLLFWDTITGQFMSYLPLTLIYVLTASMVMALIFLPTLGALFGPKKSAKSGDSLKALSGADGDPLSLKGFTGAYAKLINKLARYPELVLLVMLPMVVGIFIWFGNTEHRAAFFTQQGGDEIYVYGRARGNNSVYADYEIAQLIDGRLKNIDGVKSVFTIAGDAASAGGGFGGPSAVPLDTISRTFLELKPFEERHDSEVIAADIRAALENMPGLLTEIEVVSQGPPVGKDITVELTSDNNEKLTIAAQRLSAFFSTHESLISVEDTLPLPGIEWQLEIDRAEAGRLGVDVGTIGAAVQFVTEGSLVGFYRPLDADEEIDIRIGFPRDTRNLSALDNLRIQTRAGSIPLSSVVKRVPKPQQDAISRRDQMRVFEVKGNVRKEFAINQVVEDINAWLEQSDIAPDVNYGFLGQDEENKAAGAFFAKAGIATLFMMAVILLWQFNSFWHVFLTLSAVIFSIAGVLLGLQFYPYISIVLSGVGVLALAGIVVNNNIVLIDTYQRLLGEGYAPHEAVVRTSAQRLRPVMLTTFTTIIGLMPMVLAVQADLFTGEYSSQGNSTSGIWAPISYVLVCGLAFSTILTLVLTPVLLAAPSLWQRRTVTTYRWIKARFSKA